MHQGLWEILSASEDEEKKSGTDKKEKARMQDMQYKAYSTLILNLTDRVLRKVSKEDSGAWEKLE